MVVKIARFFLILFYCLASCKGDEEPAVSPGLIQLVSVRLGVLTLNITEPSKNTDGAVDQPLVITFASALDTTSVRQSIKLTDGVDTLALSYQYLDELKSVSLLPKSVLKNSTNYSLVIRKSLRGKRGENFPGYTIQFKTMVGVLRITQFTIDGRDALGNVPLQNVNRQLTGTIAFSSPVNTSVTEPPISLVSGQTSVPLSLQWLNSSTLKFQSSSPLSGLMRYRILFNTSLVGQEGEIVNESPEVFYTDVDPEPKFPLLSDEMLLTLVQQQTFKYFYDFAHPASGMARERNTSGNIVTSGGSGFGIMALIVGIERNFISREQGMNQMDKILDFLETADRFHGAWSHWIDGNTGKVVPFSTKDNGGDLVETSFLVQGLLTFRQYLNTSVPAEKVLIDRINTLWEGVEWDWYRRNNEQVLYWHWSPNYGWEMNFPMYGYFEQQITYFLAASSPTHSIPKSVYTNGFGRNGAIKTGNSYYNIVLPLGTPSPLFWVHYSYLGLDPQFSDEYANYHIQNTNASLINYAYCVANPKNFVGYSDQCWGLTSSDNQRGYDAHSPSNDLGVITPTAALSSFPYTPEESMKALKFFYYTLGDRTWGPYGFFDAFNLTEGWVADSYLAIDQGPIIVMIENHRSGLLWNLFMSAPEVQAGMTKLGFVK